MPRALWGSRLLDQGLVALYRVDIALALAPGHRGKRSPRTIVFSYTPLAEKPNGDKTLHKVDIEKKASVE
jgi:hypothetical protein